MEKNKQNSEKYLTDMKELPPVESGIVKPLPQKVLTVTPKLPAKKTNIEEYSPNNRYFTFKDVALGVINFMTLIFLIVLLTKLPAKGEELKSLRINALKDSINPEVLYAGLDESEQKVEEIKPLFLDDSGIVKFVNQLDSLKSSDPTIKTVTFTSQSSVKDKTGSFGIPVVISMTGSWSEISTALQKIESLNYIFRPVNINVSHKEADPNVIVFDYGIFLYVDEKSIPPRTN